MTEDNKTYKLMLKKHNKTHLQYLCVTTRDDYEKYLGSGNRWLNHLKVHGYDIHTLLIAEYPMSELEQFNERCIKLSKMLNVVEDKNFANLCEERGYEGGVLGYKHTPETLDKMSAAKIGKTGENHPRFGKKHSQETLDKMSAAKIGKTGENHPRFGKKHSQETLDKMSGKNHPRYGKGDHYIVTTPDGEEVYVEGGITRWCKERGLNKSALRKVAQGRHKHYKGYTARFATEEEKTLYLLNDTH